MTERFTSFTALLAELKSRFQSALAGLTDRPDEYLDQIRRSQDAKFGDYQANFAMSLGNCCAARRRADVADARLATLGAE